MIAKVGVLHDWRAYFASPSPDARWNDNDLSCITSLTLGDFEPVNVSSLMLTSDSGATTH